MSADDLAAQLEADANQVSTDVEGWQGQRERLFAAAARIRELEADCARLSDAVQGLMVLKEQGLEREDAMREAGDALAAAMREQRGAGSWLKRTDAALDRWDQTR